MAATVSIAGCSATTITTHKASIHNAGTALLAISDAVTPVCEIDDSVTASPGRYSADVTLNASVALPGESGVDVVMTSYGAVAAVNTSDGALLHWVNPETGELKQTVSLPGQVNDIAGDGGSVLAVALNNKILRLNASSGEVLSEISLSGASRVALSARGEIGAIAQKTVYLYDRSNTEIFSKPRDYTRVTDIELRSCNDQSLVYVTSFQNNSFIDLNDRRNPVQIARLEALDFNGQVQWSLFDNSTETIKQNVADTRLYRVTMGRDGYLYIAGESAGTATIFRWRGQPMTDDEQFGRARPFVSRIDEHSQLHNSGASHLTYYARVHPTEGQLVTAQMSFPRQTNRKASTMRVGDIAVGESGSLLFGGAASASIANRDRLTINGAPVGDYAGRDRAWMSVAPDFRDRNFWTVLATDSEQGSGKGIVQGVDAGYGYSAALSNVESGTVPVTTGPQEGTVFLSFTAE